MATDDMLADFNPATAHLRICRKEEASEYDCNRHCASRLYDVAMRLVRDKAFAEVDAANPVKPPECENHNEAAKRDGNPPWCSWCGWRHEVKAEPARKIGPSAEEKSAGAKHLPWTPSTGYGPQVPEVHLGPQHPGGYLHECTHQVVCSNGYTSVCISCGEAV